MQINLIIQALIHLFKQMFLDYLLDRSEGERNQYFCKLPWAVCGREWKGE